MFVRLSPCIERTSPCNCPWNVLKWNTDQFSTLTTERRTIENDAQYRHALRHSDGCGHEERGGPEQSGPPGDARLLHRLQAPARGQGHGPVLRHLLPAPGGAPAAQRPDRRAVPDGLPPGLHPVPGAQYGPHPSGQERGGCAAQLRRRKALRHPHHRGQPGRGRQAGEHQALLRHGRAGHVPDLERGQLHRLPQLQGPGADEQGPHGLRQRGRGVHAGAGHPGGREPPL